jgi:hypothetical protein
MKTIYFVDLTGMLRGSYELPEGESMPENATETEPPEIGEGYLCRWNGGEWVIEAARLMISY